MAIFYHPDVTKTAHAFDTTRKGADVAASLVLQGWHINTPAPITHVTATRYHAHDYVDALVTGEPIDLAESQGFTWDTYTWQSVAAQAGAMVDAAQYACQHGRAYALSAGFHHARKGIGAGFCSLNGLSIAAGEVLATDAHRQVLVLDVDAHCGGGTMSMCAGWERFIHVDIQTNRYDGYASRIPHHQAYIHNANDYLSTLQQLLTTVATQLNPGDLVLYNAGMDIHEDCRIGGLDGITTDIIRQRETLVSEWAHAHSLCVAACLAGGYAGGSLTHETLVSLHTMSVEIWLGDTD